MSTSYSCFHCGKDLGEDGEQAPLIYYTGMGHMPTCEECMMAREGMMDWKKGIVSRIQSIPQGAGLKTTPDRIYTCADEKEVVLAKYGVEKAKQHLRNQVRLAKSRGYVWEEIGDWLGVSKQYMWAKYADEGEKKGRSRKD